MAAHHFAQVPVPPQPQYAYTHHGISYGSGGMSTMGMNGDGQGYYSNGNGDGHHNHISGDTMYSAPLHFAQPQSQPLAAVYGYNGNAQLQTQSQSQSLGHDLSTLQQQHPYDYQHSAGFPSFPSASASSSNPSPPTNQHYHNNNPNQPRLAYQPPSQHIPHPQSGSVSPSQFDQSHSHSHSHSHPPRDESDSPDGRPVLSSKEKSSGKWKEGPVKNACLSCRSKKAKCDGQLPVCGQCVKKQLECVYVKSRRGGARKKREVVPPSALQEFLKKLDNLLSIHDPSLSPTSDVNDDTHQIVRQFTSRDEIFRCYYNEVHPFLPVMPPRAYLSEILPTLLDESPFLLAAETIMVLVPHPLDPNPKSAASKRIRLCASQALGKRTMLAIENLLKSSSSIECVQALAMLSMWEWGAAGNLENNRARGNQAVQVAMEMGIHEMDKHSMNGGRGLEGEDWRKDMARRTWWAAYAGQMTAAIVSGNSPVLHPDDPRIKIDYPVCSKSDTAWPNWINTQRHCVRVFETVNTVYYSQGGGNSWGGKADPTAGANSEALKRRMVEIDAEILELIRQAETTAVIELVPGGEEEVVRNQQLSARLGLAVTHIMIHRQQAFPEVSLFSKQICGLPQAPDFIHSQESVPQVTDGFRDSPMNSDIATSNGSEMRPALTNQTFLTDTTGVQDYDITDDMWQPDTYPENLPAPWFSHHGGAAALYQPTEQLPNHIPPLTATIKPIPSSDGRRDSLGSSGSQRPHQAWGVDKDDKVSAGPNPSGQLGIEGAMQIFPPGISLARCAAAAHTIVRLEVLHRSAVIALWDGPPKWLPFCSCGLVTGAYAFLLLALAVQAENDFSDGRDSANKAQEVENLLTNVKVILAGLEAYGVMWAGIEVMAGEVRAALEAASRLPAEIRAQIESASGSPSSVPDGSQD